MQFISEAFAAAETAVKTSAADKAVASVAGSNPMLSSFLLLGLFTLFIYFFMWRPQSKRIKEHRRMMDSLKVGDEIITSGGLLGKIKQIEENFLHVSIADQVTIQVQKSAVASILPKGTIK